MPVVMDDPQSLDFLLLESGAPDAQRSQPHPVADDAQVLHAFTPGQGRTHFHGLFHDPVGEVEVDLGVPVAVLDAPAEESASPWFLVGVKTRIQSCRVIEGIWKTHRLRAS